MIALRGLPKIHKDNVPIRPLVNFTPAPTYKIAKILESLIRREVVLENSSSIKNNLELVEKIQNIEIKDSYMLAPLDIVKLYTNVQLMKR